MLVRHTQKTTKSRTLPSDTIMTMPQPTVEQVSRRAYEIYLQRGSTPGTPESDWYQAEQELRGRLLLLGKP